MHEGQIRFNFTDITKIYFIVLNMSDNERYDTTSTTLHSPEK